MSVASPCMISKPGNSVRQLARAHRVALDDLHGQLQWPSSAWATADRCSHPGEHHRSQHLRCVVTVQLCGVDDVGGAQDQGIIAGLGDVVAAGDSELVAAERGNDQSLPGQTRRRAADGV